MIGSSRGQMFCQTVQILARSGVHLSPKPAVDNDMAHGVIADQAGRIRQTQPRCGAKSATTRKMPVQTSTMAAPEAMLM